MKYRYNPSCGCARCRAHGFMGPTVLITIGVLFLLDQVTGVYWLEFDRHLAGAADRDRPDHVPAAQRSGNGTRAARVHGAAAGAAGATVAPPGPPQPWQPPAAPASAQRPQPLPSLAQPIQAEVHNG